MNRPLHAVLSLVVVVALALVFAGCRDRARDENTVQFAPFDETVTEGGAPAPAPADGTADNANPESSDATASAPQGQDGPAPTGGGASASGQPTARGGPQTATGGTASTGPAPSAGAPATTEPRTPGAPSGPGPAASGRSGPGGADAERRDGEGRRRSPFERFDANGDGKLTAAEIPEEFRERMMGADTNGDGAVTQAEMQAAMKALREQWQAGRGGLGGPGGPDGPGGEGRRRSPFERFDANDDGVVTSAEVPEEARERIMRSDTNGDGKLTREEWEAAMRAFRERMQSGAGGPRGGGRRGDAGE